MILKHLWVPLPLCPGHGPEWSQGGNQGVPEKRGRFFRSGRHVAIYMGAKTKVHNVCVIYAQYFFFDTRSRDELPPSFRQIQYTEVATRACFPYLFPQPGKKWRELSGHGITEEYDWSICADIFLTSELLHPGHELSKHGQTEEKTEDCPWGTSFNLMSRWTWTNITSGTRRIELFHMCDKIVFMHCIPANTKPQSRVKSWLCLKSI